MTGAPCGIVWWSSENASQVSPASRTWPGWSSSPISSSASARCPTNPPWTPGVSGPSPCRRRRRLRNGPADHDTEQGDRDRHRGLQPDRAVGDEEGEQTGRERTDGQEDRKEGRARKLEHKQRQRCDEPDRVDRHDLSLSRSRSPVVRRARGSAGPPWRSGSSIPRREGDGKPAMRWRYPMSRNGSSRSATSSGVPNG